MNRLLAFVIVSFGALTTAQVVPLEYQVKAAYLFNFTRFVGWPEGTPAAAGPLTICVAEINPFGPVLESTLAGETAAGRMLTTRVVRNPTTACHVLFIPRGVPAGVHLRAVGMLPILTVGESTDFIQQGGMINFVLEGGRVRFEINQGAALRNHLTISARLLQLARSSDQAGAR